MTIPGHRSSISAADLRSIPVESASQVRLGEGAVICACTRGQDRHRASDGWWPCGTCWRQAPCRCRRMRARCFWRRSRQSTRVRQSRRVDGVRVRPAPQVRGRRMPFPGQQQTGGALLREASPDSFSTRTGGPAFLPGLAAAGRVVGRCTPAVVRLTHEGQRAVLLPEPAHPQRHQHVPRIAVHRGRGQLLMAQQGEPTERRGDAERKGG